MADKKNWLSRLEEEFMANYKDAIEFKSLYMRTLADFNQFKKRIEREISEAKDKGKEELLMRIFPAIDNLARALEVIKNENDVENSEKLLRGVEMIYKQIKSILEEQGAEIIEVKEGEDFNPEEQEAIDIEETDNEELDKKVIKEVQKGMRYKGRVIVPSRVVVSRLRKKEEGSSPSVENEVKEVD
jgi:molecular chaperone GrpE